ncbi:BRO-N domain-containing protein [Dysosmobacter sp.]|uniref:BRO-N domain-containing protein n=1 Tax=Dysosmobacter sp. TaxID=2591382 RepID=UPI002A9C8947|nr:Bro-N domain-containing protein [Dysosmobacter sp.]MDY5510987.1 Bro-N domain-containing protein [Dysosmobacter sp.]
MSNIRTAWNEEKEEWYFSIVDVVSILTDSADPAAYWRKLKQRLKAEGNETVTNCHGLKMTAADGKKRLTDVADTEQLLRIIQAIPSPKAEPFKLWLAQVGRERIEETIDPELTIERALETYLKKGYTREWINQRLQAIQVRKELTDEWDARGVQKGIKYAILTDEITRAWSGMSTRQYKNLKGLKIRRGRKERAIPSFPPLLSQNYLLSAPLYPLFPACSDSRLGHGLGQSRNQALFSRMTRQYRFKSGISLLMISQVVSGSTEP